MKSTLLKYLSEDNMNQIIEVISFNMGKINERVLMHKDLRSYLVQLGVMETLLTDAIRNKRVKPALQAIDTLRVFYRTYGVLPTDKTEGYYEMFAFLDQVGLFVAIASSALDAKWTDK